MNVQQFTKDIAGRPMTIEVGKLAQQANASCTVRYGDTVVLATATMSKSAREGLDFFPLMVDYEERLYAGGKIKGSRFVKREGRPSDEAVLIGRMIDRGLRPLFNDQIRNDVQVVCTVLSIDKEHEPDVTAITAASAALALSDIPWNGPIAGVRVGKINGELVLNPAYSQFEQADLNLVFSGDGETVIMVDADAKEATEEEMIEAFAFGSKTVKEIVDLIREAVTAAGKDKKNILDIIPNETEETLKQKEEVLAQADAFVAEQIKPWLLEKEVPTKALRKNSLDEIKKALKQHLIDAGIEETLVGYAVGKSGKLIENHVSDAILEHERRVDGRSLTDIRPLSAEVGVLPRTHGSGLFNRGETQVLSAVTLAGPGMHQIVESMDEEGKKYYMHHYIFPPFSVGETAPMRGPGRRDIGHGALAEKALVPVLPSREEFPYTIRVMSEVLGSNGSSSMASTCGSTLALMDAGVPIKKHVAGIAMGLVSDGNGSYKILTDLQDLEDGKGGMDFKITGTRDGITAIQMDTKTAGLTMEIIRETFVQGKDARYKVLDLLESVIPAPRPDLSQFAPRITSFMINPEKIGEVIGPGGKMINQIIDETGVEIDIEDDGMVMVTGDDAAMAQKAVDWIKSIVKEIEVGELYEGKVVRIMDFGAFVELTPGKDGMIHISKMAPHRIEKVTDVLEEGMMVKVKVEEIDEKGRVNLALLEGGKTPPPPKPRPDRGLSGRDGGRGSRDRGPRDRDKKRGFFKR